jgi:SAM-dependent methyltransferase
MTDRAQMDGPGLDDPRRHAPATLRNRAAILAVLPKHLPAHGRILEIASGSGEHAAFLTPRLPDGLVWAPSDVDPDARAGIDAHARAAAEEHAIPPDRIEGARQIDVSRAGWVISAPIDAIFCANMIHIAPWGAALGLLEGAGRQLPPGGPLILYGPFKRDGAHTAPSNAAFDLSLRARDPSWGVRDLEGDILPAAEDAGLALDAVETMPANNLIVVLRSARP